MPRVQNIISHALDVLLPQSSGETGIGVGSLTVDSLSGYLGRNLKITSTSGTYLWNCGGSPATLTRRNYPILFIDNFHNKVTKIVVLFIHRILLPGQRGNAVLDPTELRVSIASFSSMSA